MFGIGSERVIGAREVISWRAKLEGYGTNQYRHLRRESGRVPWVLRYGSVLSDCDVVKLDKNNTNKSHSKSTTFEHCTAASTPRVKKRRCISLIHCKAKLPVDSNQVTARVFSPVAVVSLRHLGCRTSTMVSLPSQLRSHYRLAKS